MRLWIYEWDKKMHSWSNSQLDGGNINKKERWDKSDRVDYLMWKVIIEFETSSCYKSTTVALGGLLLSTLEIFGYVSASVDYLIIKSIAAFEWKRSKDNFERLIELVEAFIPYLKDFFVIVL